MIENPTWAPQSYMPNIVLTNNNRIDLNEEFNYQEYPKGYYIGRLHSVGLTADGEHCYLWVNYGPIDVAASSWIVPGTIEPVDFEEENEDV